MDRTPGHDKGLLPMVNFGFEWQFPSGRSLKRKSPSDMRPGPQLQGDAPVLGDDRSNL